MQQTVFDKDNKHMILILPHRAVFNSTAHRATWQDIHLKKMALLMPAVYLAEI
jgi:hypothetical protein